VTATIKAFDPKTPELKTISRFTVKSDRSILGDCGQSFRVASRRIQKRDADLDEDAAKDATRQDDKGSQSGTANSKPPDGNASPDPADSKTTDDAQVKLTIFYDGQAQSLEGDRDNPGERRVRMVRRRSGGGAPVTIASPNDVKAIELVLENVSSSDTLGVVLKVNGQNTLFQETEDAANCHKWILEPGKKYTIRGYYLEDSGNNLRPFKALSEEESKQKEREITGNDKLGLIEMHVFRSSKRDALDVSRKVSLRGLSPYDSQKRRPRSLTELQSRLEKQTHVRPQGQKLTPDVAALAKKAPAPVVRQKKDRGLIVGDENKTEGGTLVRREFENPEEVSNQVIRYYTRQGSASPGTQTTGN
jgi:hypothetical protein